MQTVIAMDVFRGKISYPIQGYQNPAVQNPVSLKPLLLLQHTQIAREHLVESFRFKPVKQPGNLHRAGYFLHLKDRFQVVPIQFLLHLLLNVQQGRMLKEKNGKGALNRIQ
jgi:hypothetical protein